jgi:tetratricopeptide (TPR) repeat protein
LHKPALDLAIALGEWTRAEAHLLAFKNLEPDRQAFVCSEIQLQLAQGQVPQEVAATIQRTSVCPEMLDTLQNLATDLFYSGQFDATVPLLINLIALDPENLQAQTLLAMHSAAVDPENAIDQLRKVQTVGNPDARLALELLITIQDSQATDPPAYLFAKVGQAFARQDRWQLAKEAFQNAILLSPDYAQAWGFLGVARDRIGLDGENELLQAVRLAPEDPLLLILLGVHYNEKGKPAEALPILERAAALDTENPAIAAELGQTYDSLGDLESARLAYRQATFIAPDVPSFWLLLADFSLRYELEVETLALPAVRNALILKPGLDQSWRALGYAHYLLGNYPLAERALLRALVISPSHSTGQYYLGLLFQAQGQSAQAISAWTLAAKLDPDHPHARLAGRALENLVNPE